MTLFLTGPPIMINKFLIMSSNFYCQILLKLCQGFNGGGRQLRNGLVGLEENGARSMVACIPDMRTTMPICHIYFSVMNMDMDYSSEKKIVTISGKIGTTINILETKIYMDLI